MKGAIDLTEVEAQAWVAAEIAACITPEQRFRRAQVERELMERYKQRGLDRQLPIATRAQRDLIAALDG